MTFEQHVFISDVHLGAFSAFTNKKIEEDLIALINHCKEQRFGLYILGDLFDFWMEYPEKGFVPNLGEKVLNAFEEYNKEVKPALYITGNHDNWTFGHFKERGFEVESNFRMMEIEDKHFLLMHGDGVAASDIDFPRAAFHRLLRNNRFIEIYQQILAPARGIAAMKLFSSITRKRNYQNPKPLNRQAKRIFSKHKLDYILCGHDHIPRVETFSRGQYINLGTFFNHRSVAVYNNDGLKLVTWQAEPKLFLPFGRTKETL
ncbi:MAG: metallophosphoesterase [Balneolaceae bacterium]